MKTLSEVNALDRYEKCAIEEYIQRQRTVLEKMRDEGIFTQSHVESELDGIRRKIVEDFNLNKAFAMLVMELDANKLKIDDSNLYVSLTDIARIKNSNNPSYVIQSWLRDRNTLELLYLWEKEHNPDFHSPGYVKIKRRLSDPSFTLTTKIWKEETNAIGIISKPGNGGGTLAQRDIAIDFYALIFPEKRYELIKVIAGKAAFFETIQGEIKQMKVIEPLVD